MVDPLLLEPYRSAKVLRTSFSGFINSSHVESCGSLILALWLLHLQFICMKLLEKISQFKYLRSAPINKNKVHDKTMKVNSTNVCY